MLPKYLKLFDLGQRTTWIECDLIDLKDGDVVIDKYGGSYIYKKGDPETNSDHFGMTWVPIKLIPEKQIQATLRR